MKSIKNFQNTLTDWLYFIKAVPGRSFVAYTKRLLNICRKSPINNLPHVTPVFCILDPCVYDRIRTSTVSWTWENYKGLFTQDALRAPHGTARRRIHAGCVAVCMSLHRVAAWRHYRCE